MSTKNSNERTLTQHTLLWDLQSEEAASPANIPTFIDPSLQNLPNSSDDVATIVASADTPTLIEVNVTPNELIAGRYRVIGILGKGGMGEVLRVLDEKLAVPWL